MDGPVLDLGAHRPERADAARNRQRLLATAREMMAELGAEKVTMDGLAERSGLGKGTVFRRFGTRAGIFQALLDEDERVFQQAVLSGPAPLGPGADPIDRLIAYGRARVDFLSERQTIARATLERSGPIPAGPNSFSRAHIGMLLRQAQVGIADLDSLAVQLVAALEGPILLYLAGPANPTEAISRLAGTWQALIERLR